ncbi:MAG TPA: excinuclease ABC subunit UvrA [Candidatus Latescibacteria bacterium]|nr:excinuclease ABC subunit UvrA [Candidatus Latescibacterota bacterium]
MERFISVRGARVHNLKNINVDLPHNKLILITGVSGSGKSSLAFDTLYAEGQRRYVESLSSYVRQFLERMDRPDVDEIRGIPPAMAIEQKNPVRTSRSTVATATEIHDYLRLLFARIGRTYCPGCGEEVRKDRVEEVVRYISSLGEGTRVMICFPLRADDPHDLVLDLVELRSQGFYRLVMDDQVVSLEGIDVEDLKKKDEILVLVDRLILHGRFQQRLANSLEMAFKEGGGRVIVILPTGEPLRFSQAFECSRCGVEFIDPQPRLFSFNSPFGACPTCKGFGDIIKIDMDLVVPDKKKSINQGAIEPWNTPGHSDMLHLLKMVAPRYGLDLDKPFEQLEEKYIQLIKEGDGTFPGLNKFFKWLESKKYKIGVRVFLSRYRGYIPCPDCKGARLRPEALNVKVGGKDISEVSRMTVEEVYRFFNDLELTQFEREIAHQVLKELRNRLGYLLDVGLGYLTLDRRSSTLSGGETQRTHLATALGSRLVGSLYILDEPSIGLHPRDNDRLIGILKALRDLGNTVLVVEHDREMMKVSDRIIDLGPRAGENGGRVVFQGSYREILRNGSSLTGMYLRDEKRIPLPTVRRRPDGRFLTVRGASEHNLKDIDVEIPLGLFVVITGVSGSGKSTLIHDVLYTALKKELGSWKRKVGRHDSLAGVENIADVILVDQSPIGRTPRSNPATYIKAFDGVRDVFAKTRLARVRGYTPGTFSFNVAGGRCEVCQGAGVVKIEMQFMADLYLRCEVCGGRRFRQEVLEVEYRGKNIDEVLNMGIREAMEFFSDVPTIYEKLKILDDVGLGYMRMGQPATTLSGGEAQRVKLAAHLAGKKGRHILYLFDEPTTGLHFDDIAKLLNCFNRLIEAGNSVIVIEHNLEVIKCADYIIDLGPEGGNGGGRIVTAGTPEEISSCDQSYTGRYLRPYLQKSG